MRELLAESWKDFVTVAWEWDFVNLAVALLVILLIGSGLIKSRIRSVAWGIALAVLWSALHAGVARSEWGEVLFNGTLL